MNITREQYAVEIRIAKAEAWAEGAQSAGQANPYVNTSYTEGGYTPLDPAKDNTTKLKQGEYLVSAPTGRAVHVEALEMINKEQP